MIVFWWIVARIAQLCILSSVLATFCIFSILLFENSRQWRIVTAVMTHCHMRYSANAKCRIPANNHKIIWQARTKVRDQRKLRMCSRAPAICRKGGNIYIYWEVQQIAAAAPFLAAFDCWDLGREAADGGKTAWDIRPQEFGESPAQYPANTRASCVSQYTDTHTAAQHTEAQWRFCLVFWFLKAHSICSKLRS